MLANPGLTLKNNVPEDPGPVPYTLRIGVTGHRELQDPFAVTAAVERLLVTIRRSLEEGNTDLARTTRLHWKVVSALAKGTDQIVARAAMEKLDASLDVVLPAEPDVYRKDFTDPDDLKEFNSLFEKAGNYPLLMEGKATFPSSIKEGYEQAGKTLVDTCEILIAVWDGKPARGQGGTASVVSYACSANRLVVWINALNPGSPAVILTQVKEAPGTHGSPVSNDLSLVTRAIPKNASGWSSRYVQVAEYNRDRAFRKSSYNEVLRRNLRKMEDTARDTGLLPENIQPLLTAILPHYARADSLAVHYRKLHTRSAGWLYRLAAIAVTFAVLQAFYFPGLAVWTVMEITALVIAVLLFRINMLKRWNEKWMDYRHLAERLRILLFQSLAGGGNSETPKISHRLPFYPGPGGWVLEVFDEIKRGLPPCNIRKDRLDEAKRFIVAGWIADQADYHLKNAGYTFRQSSHDQIKTGLMLAVTLTAAIIHLSGVVHDRVLENMIFSLVIILPAFASAQHAIAGVHDFKRMAERSARMNEMLRGIESKIMSATGWDELYNEISRAEDIMSTENHEWCVSLSFRRVSLPV
jgi:hypothetical protein